MKHLTNACVMSDAATEHNNSTGHPDLLLQAILVLGQRLAVIEHAMGEVKEVLCAQRIEKDWYTTNELAQALHKSHFTIQERSCNDGRIECQKDPNSGKWRIPGHEYRRLVNGGTLKPKQRTAPVNAAYVKETRACFEIRSLVLPPVTTDSL